MTVDSTKSSRKAPTNHSLYAKLFRKWFHVFILLFQLVLDSNISLSSEGSPLFGGLLLQLLHVFMACIFCNWLHAFYISRKWHLCVCKCVTFCAQWFTLQKGHPDIEGIHASFFSTVQIRTSLIVCTINHATERYATYCWSALALRATCESASWVAS